MWKQWLVTLLMRMVTQVTPAFLEDLREFIRKEQAEARTTPNPFDDMFWDTMGMLFGTPKAPAGPSVAEMVDALIGEKDV